MKLPFIFSLYIFFGGIITLDVLKGVMSKVCVSFLSFRARGLDVDVFISCLAGLRG